MPLGNSAFSGGIAKTACRVLNFSRFSLIILFVLGGCASTPEKSASPPAIESPKAARAKPAAPPSASVKPALAASQPVAPVDDYGIVIKLLPDKLKDREGWADDLQSAFRSLQIRPTAENYCATIAVIEQESSFQADPVVPGLPAIVRRGIEQRREKYLIPQAVVDWMLAATSSDGRSYGKRIDALRTEKELSDLVEEIVAQVPSGQKLFPNYNPVHTGGPMQVSVEFAESHVRARPYPYPVHGNLRNEVFSRRGGIYFGSAILLDYPAPYDDMRYRFADFNSGRYSCRNAAFQQALSRLTGRALATDGDLLRYNNGSVSAEPSATLNALRTLENTLHMSNIEIQRDLHLEKLASFAGTQLYVRLFAAADQTGIQPRVLMPEIDLKSPKIHRKLTTHWFANRVYDRYRNCLRQADLALRKPAGKAKPRHH